MNNLIHVDFDSKDLYRLPKYTDARTFMLEFGCFQVEIETYNFSFK